MGNRVADLHSLTTFQELLKCPVCFNFMPSPIYQNSVVAMPGLPGMQAVALSINGDKAMFYNVRLLGAQDTLMDLSGTHYFNQCYIQGSIDFIFGGARSIYKGCVIESITTTSGAIAAHRMESPNDGTGFSFVNCTIIGIGKPNLFSFLISVSHCRVMFQATLAKVGHHLFRRG
ncbi:pectinesterase QRT1-like [Vitis vinifera]|uniref:pectinesterase QRT1-like n=1 Tax=Vitis vinifera TaxID=29760 RepID=UPI0028833101|nr:pectinesterase QRT1-like [Vitis vinifera]